MTKPNPTCHPKVWSRLTALYAARQTAKNRESDLVRLRKDLDGELDELGAGSTQKHLKVSRDFVVTVRSIDKQRDRVRSIADKIDATINFGIDGQLDFDNEDLDDLVKAVDESELFHRPDHEKDSDGPGRHPDDKEQTKLPVGPNGPLDEKIVDHDDIPGPLAAKLLGDGSEGFFRIETWRELDKYVEARGISAPNTVMPAEYKRLRETLAAVKKKHAGPRAPKDNGQSDLQFPGQFIFRTAGLPRRTAEVACNSEADLFVNLRAWLQTEDFTVVGSDVLRGDTTIVTIERVGDMKPAAKPGESVDMQTGEIQKQKGGRKAGRKGGGASVEGR